MRSEEEENTDAVLDYQAVVALVSAQIARASRRASLDLMNDMGSILSTYTAKGGFESTEEARAYLQGYIEPKDRATLIEAARKLPEPERTRQLTRLSSSAYNWRMSRAEALDKMQRMSSIKLRRDIEDRLIPALNDTVEKGVKRTVYSTQKELGMGFRFDLPSEKNIDQVVTGTGVYDRVKLFSKQEMEGVKEIVTKGMLSGRDLKTMTREVEQLTGKAPYKARRLVRTTVAQAAVDAELKELEELGITEYEIQCTFDERLCPICRKYDGKKYKLGKGPTPTFHPNCRCRVRQIIPKEFQKGLTKAARDSDGNTINVPYNMSYDTWEKKYGKGKGQGGMTVDPPKMRPEPAKKKVGPQVRSVSSAKDMNELVEIVKTRWNIEGFDVDGVHYERIEADSFKDLDFGLVKDSFVKMDTVFVDFPELKQSKLGFGVLAKRGKEDASIFYGFEDGSMQFSFSRSYTNRVSFENRVRNAARTGDSPAGIEASDIAVHEMGHVIEQSMFYKKHGSYKKGADRHEFSKTIKSEAWKAVKKEYAEKGITKVGDAVLDLSLYATTDSAEMFAEAFADYYANGDNAKPLSKEIVKITKKKWAELFR